MSGGSGDKPAGSPEARPTVPLRRLFLLTIVTAGIALALQAALAATEAPSAGAISLLVIPFAAATVIFLGLRPYPVIGRLRLAMMAAVALFIVGLGL